MSDNRDAGERSSSEPSSSIKMEQVRAIPGGALVRTLPPQQRFIMTPVQQSSTALIQASSTTTIQAQVLPKVAVQGANSSVGRISTVPMQSAATSTGGFHVPKGPAAVANITVPRSSNVAAPMVRGTSLQAISVAPHSIPGNIATTAGAMQIGRSVVSSVAPWVGISSAQQSNIPRQAATHIRPAIQHISEPTLYPCSPPHSKPYPRSRATPKYVSETKPKSTLVSYENSSSDEDSDPLPSNFSSRKKSYNRLVSYNSSDDESSDLPSGSKISSQVRPLDQRMVIHASTTHKQVITQQAQVQLSAGGNDPSKGQATVLKSYSGAGGAARLVAPPSATNLPRIATIPSAMVSLHSAAVLLPSSQGIPVKTTVAQPKVITQPVHSSSNVQFPSVSSATVQPALALNTVQVSRPALVTVMLSPSVAAAGTQPQGVTHIKPHPSGGGAPQLIQQGPGAGLSQGSSTVSKLYADGPHTITAANQPVFIQTQGSLPGQVPQKAQLPAALIVREPSRSKEELVSSTPSGVNLSGTVYSLTGGSYYDGQSYIKVPQQHQTISSNMTASSGPQQPSLHIRQTSAQITPISSSASATSSTQGLRMNPVMVMDTGRTQITPFTSSVDSGTSMSASDTNMAALALTSQALKQTTSPRPSILRKREPEGSPIKATKNLAPVLSGLTVSAGSPPFPPGSPPKRPESGQSGVSSSGSTTVSANSSPGESPTAALKHESVDDDMASSTSSVVPTIMAAAAPRPPVVLSHPPPPSSAQQTEMSPRKKPRKQQLSGNQIVSEPTFSEDEMEFITEDKVKKEMKEDLVEDVEKAAPKKTMSLLSAYKHNWKGRNNHFNRYTDVKPKEERKPTLSEIANQKNVVQKLTGWKIYHIATHLEDLANSETEFFGEYNSTLSFLEDKLGKCRNREMEKDFHRITERVRANYQRSRVVKDHMVEARSQLFKLLEHKSYISDIINRNTIKRPLKKRERL